jgi:hypothetical protein
LIDLPHDCGELHARHKQPPILPLTNKVHRISKENLLSDSKDGKPRVPACRRCLPRLQLLGGLAPMNVSLKDNEHRIQAAALWEGQ